MSARRRPYVESPVIMATVRLVAPFVLTFGIFVTLHGASSPGGGFQGGVILAAVIVMLSFAYGIDLTWEWLEKRALIGLVTGGVALFVLVSLGTVLFGGGFLELAVYPVDDASKYGIELVEVAIAMIVTGVITSLFFTLARGTMSPTEGEEAGSSDREPAEGTTTDGGVDVPSSDDASTGGRRDDVPTDDRRDGSTGDRRTGGENA